MNGGAIVAPNAPIRPTNFGRAREVASDLLIATALLWAPVVLLGAVAALVKLLLGMAS